MLLLAPGVAYASQTLSLTPQDTTLNLDTNNYSGHTGLMTYTWPDYQVANAILMKFDLSSFPAGAMVSEATLHLALVQSDGQPETTYTVTAHKVVGKNPAITGATGYTADGVTGWTANTCCYNSVPLAQADISAAYDTQAIDKTTGYKAWTITQMVQEWLADPATNFGLLLNSDPSKPRDRYRFFASMEHSDTSIRPLLRITYSVPSVLSLTPQDTWINLDAKNYSGGARLRTYTWPDYQVANAILMKFDLSSLPAGAVIQEATLHLALLASDGAAETTYTVTAHKVVGKNPAISGATGYTADGVTGWTANTCCYNSVPLAQADISAASDSQAIDKTLGFKAWTITQMVQEWLADPATNFGLLLNSDASKPRDRYRTFASTEHSDSTLRPFLRITYLSSTSDGDSTPPVLSDITASSVTASGATISWTTNEPSDSQVEYGLTTAYGSTTQDANLVTSHQVTLSGLTDASLYHFRIHSRDAAGNLATSADFTFTTLDGTPPSVSVTDPAAGATVSGTTTVAASATDNVGVVGVQFKLDGADLGTEDTTAPYSVSWDTTTATDGSHTLTAVARDAAGNQAISGVTVTVSNSTSSSTSSTSTDGIAALYPGDVGIETDPAVIFVEQFEEATLSDLFNRWTDILNGSTMSFSSDVPPGSPGARSLDIPWVGGVSDGGHLYKQLIPGVDDTLYVRFYIKYPTSETYNHTGIWMGGYNPALSWPNPQAGVKPTGSDRFSASGEQNTLTSRFDHYNYWMGMHQSNDGKYWGNVLLNDPNVQARAGQWMCVEQMLKLNNPLTSLNGEHAIWLDGVKVSHLGQGFPNGYWSGGTFTQDPSGGPFEGFQWRTDANLNLNWIWLQVYAPGDPEGFSSSIKFDHVVVAKSYIGCLASGASDTSPPAVSITAPTGGSTVSGVAVTVSADASDDVGVVGVQFRLDGVDLGAEDTTAPYSISWDTTLVLDGSHTLTAVARDAAGNTSTSAGITVSVSNLLTSAWPNEPAGFVGVNDQPWDSLTGNGWNYLRRTASKDSDIVTDSLVPFSPLNTLRIIFTPDMAKDTEPGVHWRSLPKLKEVYTGWWIKLSSNWTHSPAGAGKITFLFTDGDQGQVYTNYYHPYAWPESGDDPEVKGPPYKIGANTEWAPYGQKVWYPNVTTTWINPGEWHRIEFYYRWEATPGVSGDGIIRWWVDGVLNGNYTNVHYPASSFTELQYAPTIQNPPPEEQYMYVDHTYVSAP